MPHDSETELLNQTIERTPSTEQIATLMSKIPPHADYWIELFDILDGNKEKEKKLGKNIIQATAITSKTFAGISDESYRHSLIGIYSNLRKMQNEETYNDNRARGGLATNPEMTTLMLHEVDNRLKSESKTYMYDSYLLATKEFLSSTAFICKSYPNGIEQCKELMATIHGIEKKQLETQQKKESEDLDKILSHQTSVKSWQKE